jgi:integrase
MSTGHVRQRGPGAWELKYDVGRDPQTGKRITRYATFRGTKGDAKRRLRELLTAVDRGEHVDAVRTTVEEHVRSRVEQWRTAGQISPRTEERYRELLDLYIAPHIGGVALQKLATAAVEKWHTTLRTSGRKDGKGGLCARTVKHAHRLLLQAYADAVRHNLVSRNVVREQKPPRSEDSEVKIVAKDQVAPMLDGLEGDPFYAPVVVALYCGLRRGEQLALRWCNVDLDAKVIRVRAALEETRKGGIAIKTPKTAAGRRDVSLPEIVVDALRKHRREAARAADGPRAR